MLGDSNTPAPANSDMEPASDQQPRTGRDEAIKLMTIANVALVGVPGAYAASHSIVVTVIAGAAAVVLVVAYLLASR